MDDADVRTPFDAAKPDNVWQAVQNILYQGIVQDSLTGTKNAVFALNRKEYIIPINDIEGAMENGEASAVEVHGTDQRTGQERIRILLSADNVAYIYARHMGRHETLISELGAPQCNGAFYGHE